MDDPVQRLAGALSELAGSPVQLERPSDPSHGDYATNVALRLAGQLKRPPREVAEELATTAATLGGVERVDVAGPGFLNLFLDDAWFVDTLGQMLGRGDGFGGGSAAAPERVQVELVSANPTGPMTVASARNAAYGDSVARLLAFAGHTVEREYYYNDAGLQMDLFRSSVEAARRGEEPPEGGYQGAYVADLAREAGDPVPRMLALIEDALERFRVRFDTFERQSVVEAEIPEAIALLETYEADGALWARTSRYGDEKDRVLIRTDGTPTYFAGDAAYVRRKYARGFDRLIYVLGADHHGYVGRLQALAEMLGHPRESIEVLIYQLVNLTRGGEATKMSKRRGDVVFLDDFVDEIGVDAARWYLVSRGHDQTIDIDIDLAAEKTAKNPVFYVQYAHARIAGILRNAERHEQLVAPPRAARSRGARPRQASCRVPRGRRRGNGAPGAARDSEPRDPRGRRLPPLLPPSQGARVRGGAVSARPLPRHEDSRRARLDLVGVEAPDRM